MMVTKDIGYDTGGVFKACIGGSPTKAYGVWCCLLQRCYCQKKQKISPTYIGCSVSETWLDFQNFAEWYTNHEFYGLGYELDKDLLYKGNKIYSAETCCLIPQEINKLLLSNPSRRGEYPQGVCYNKQKKRYQANISMNGVATHLGRFDCPQEAYEAYKTAKEAYVKERALHWRDRIAPEVYEALMAWELKDD